MKIISRSLFLLFLISFIKCGLYDIEKARSKKIIGNFYLFFPNIPEDTGHYLIYRNMKTSDKFFFQDNEYVQEIFWSDSIILLETKLDSIINYYLVYPVIKEYPPDIKKISKA